MYANLRPCKNIAGIKTPFDNVDLVVVRENTEDLYAGIEEKISDDEAHGIKLITRKSSTRIVEWAFEYALKNNTGDSIYVNWEKVLIQREAESNAEKIIDTIKHLLSR